MDEVRVDIPLKKGAVAGTAGTVSAVVGAIIEASASKALNDHGIVVPSGTITVATTGLLTGLFHAVKNLVKHIRERRRNR